MSERRLRVGLVVEPGGIDYPYSHEAYLGLDESAIERSGAAGPTGTNGRRPRPRKGTAPRKEKSTL